MSLLDIDKLVNDRLHEVKAWIENNIIFPSHISEWERGNYIDNFFEFIKKGRKYIINVKNGNLVFKESCDEVPHKLFEFYSVNGAVTIFKVKKYKGFPQVANNLQIYNYEVSDKETIFGPSVVMGSFYIKAGNHLYESNLSHDELFKNGRNLPKYIHSYCVDNFLYENTKKRFEKCIYVGKIVNIG